jgi:hypothetical protein
VEVPLRAEYVASWVTSKDGSPFTAAIVRITEDDPTFRFPTGTSTSARFVGAPDGWTLNRRSLMANVKSLNLTTATKSTVPIRVGKNETVNGAAIAYMNGLSEGSATVWKRRTSVIVLVDELAAIAVVFNGKTDPYVGVNATFELGTWV